MTDRRRGAGPYAVGDRFEARTGPIAHGGHVVARVRPEGAERDVVVFVRHALPDEWVLVEVTEVDRTLLRGDAIEVPERTVAPVPVPMATEEMETPGAATLGLSPESPFTGPPELKSA